MEQVCYQRSRFGINDDDALALRTIYVAITDPSEAWVNTGTSLLEHAFFRLLPEIQAVVARHDNHDSMRELFRRARLGTDDDIFLNEMNCYPEFIDRRPVFQVPV